jgi:murein DD-endopeptidase MepM/ murein hydrolase activator NlpD
LPVHARPIRVTGFAVKSRFLVPWLSLFACLSAAVTPALAREGGDPNAPGRAELQQDLKDSTARYLKAKGEVDRLTADVARLEQRLAGVDEQEAALRSLATRGAVALYMHDSTVEWVDGFGDGGEGALEGARRARLVGSVSDLAGAAMRDLADASRQIAEDRRLLGETRHEQETALAELNRQRQAAAGRYSAFVAAERDEQRRAEAERRQAEAERRTMERDRRRAEIAARALGQRTSRDDSTGRDRPVISAGFVCPLKGPFKWGDGWGAGRGHKGVDMLAPRGTENVAVVPGTFETRFWGGGGLTLFLLGDDGNTYVYMHLLQIVGIARHAEAGDVIALTGASGNASAYHTHFEFHPGGEQAIDPFPLLAAACPPMPRDH